MLISTVNFQFDVFAKLRCTPSPQVIVPEGLHLEFMPSHSPELQPTERLWPLVNEPIANRSFQNLDELEEVLFQRCQVLLGTIFFD